MRLLAKSPGRPLPHGRRAARRPAPVPRRPPAARPPPPPRAVAGDDGGAGGQPDPGRPRRPTAWEPTPPSRQPPTPLGLVRRRARAPAAPARRAAVPPRPRPRRRRGRRHARRRRGRGAARRRPSRRGGAADPHDRRLRGRRDAEEVADAAQVGIVIEQNPESGIRVDEGSEVEIVVGTQNLLPMPDVSGSTPDEAVNILRELGFTGDAERRRGGQRRRRSRSDHPHRTTSRSSEVAGRRPDHLRRVERAAAGARCPNVATLSESDAVDAIEAADLVPQVRQEASGDVTEGRVIRTEPAAGTEVERRLDGRDRRLERAADRDGARRRRPRRGVGRSRRSRTPGSRSTCRPRSSPAATRPPARSSSSRPPATARPPPGSTVTHHRRRGGRRRLADAERGAPARGAALRRASCATRSWPPAVRIDSGWNCTPSVLGCSRWRSPMTTPSSVQAVTSSDVGHRLGLDDERVVAGRLERVRQAGEHALAVVVDERRLAVHHLPGPGRRRRRRPARGTGGRGTRRAPDGRRRSGG